MSKRRTVAHGKSKSVASNLLRFHPLEVEIVEVQWSHGDRSISVERVDCTCNLMRGDEMLGDVGSWEMLGGAISTTYS